MEKFSFGQGNTFGFCFEKERKLDEEENERGREIEKGNCGPQPKKSFFVILSDSNRAVPNHLANKSHSNALAGYTTGLSSPVCEVNRYRQQNLNRARKTGRKQTEICRKAKDTVVSSLRSKNALNCRLFSHNVVTIGTSAVGWPP